MKNLIKTLITNLGYGESPRWHDGRLWFCNWTMQEIIVIDAGGNIENTVKLPFGSFLFSIDWLEDVACSRPRQFLAMAFPRMVLNNQLKERFGNDIHIVEL